MGIQINRCAKCGHEWPQSTKVPPRRCPAPGCRTVRWRIPMPAGLKKALASGFKVSGQVAEMVTGKGTTATEAALRWDEERRAEKAMWKKDRAMCKKEAAANKAASKLPKDWK